MALEQFLDLKDRKILYQLDVDCRRSNSEIGRLTGLSKQAVDYRIKRLLAKGLITRFATVIDTYKIGLSKYKVYISLESANKTRIKKVINFLKKHEKTEWIATCAGKWDIIAGYVVKDVYEFNEAIKEFDEKFSKYVSQRETTISISVPHWRKEYLLDNAEQYPMVLQGAQGGKFTLDSNDEEIIRILVNNGRISTTELAKMLDTTPRMVDYRIKKLKKEKIILMNRIFINLNQLNWIYCKAFLKFRNLSEERYQNLISYCDQIKNLSYIINCIGLWDMELDFEIQDFNGFYDIMLDLRDKFFGIIKTYDFVIVTNEDKLDYYPGSYPAIKND